MDASRLKRSSVRGWCRSGEGRRVNANLAGGLIAKVQQIPNVVGLKPYMSSKIKYDSTSGVVSNSRDMSASCSVCRSRTMKLGDRDWRYEIRDIHGDRVTLPT